MLTVVLYLLLTLLVILVILVGSLFLPWKFGLTGELASAPEKFTGTGSATIGANTCGISVKLQKELVIGIGPYKNPWMKKSIKPNKSKQKTVKEKPSTKKKSKTLPIGFYKNLIKSTISRVHWHRLNLQGQINFQNPMKTGITMGLIQWLKMITPADRSRIDIDTKFVGNNQTDLAGDLQFRTQPAMLVIFAGIAYIRQKNNRG